MNDTCGCCEGVELLTPKQIANRPGLNALAYRVGTHATFLEAMKARLSNYFLDIPQEGVNQQGQPWVERVYPLSGLTTRVVNDPSIAFLDAWATVGHVLTFYQERIANEAYLRTATERRSILELARLVGYALRPGVASTVYLAYTLDSNFKDEVIIPAGARSQSVPGPGELPQSFETSESLHARTSWNVLKPRMTRPQTEKTISDGGDPRVYLKGISTNLKPNDPLLIDFGAGTPQFVRVKDVQPDPAADRTRVTLQDWRAAPPAQALASPEAIAAETKRLLNKIIAGHLGSEVNERGLSRNTKMFRAVSGHLESLKQQLAEDIPFPAMIAYLNIETLPGLVMELEAAEGKAQYTKLRPWLESLIVDLNEAAARASNQRAESLAREFTLPASVNSASVNGGRAVVPGDPFTPILAGLAKPPSVPPANALQLRRSVETAFQAKADTALQVAGTFEEELRESLPITVANTKATPDVQIKVYALRVKAGLFGHRTQKRMSIPANGGEIETIGEWPIVESVYVGPDFQIIRHEEENVVYLNASYDKILPDSWIVVDASAVDLTTLENACVTLAHPSVLVSKIAQIQADTSRAEYGWVGDTTRVILGDTWLTFPSSSGCEGTAVDQLRSDAEFQIIRRTVVYAQSEALPLAEEPIDDPICGSDDASVSNAFIELDGFYSDLQAGRWLIVSGERTDIQVPDPNNPGATVPVPGVKFSELVMLADVVQRVSEAEQVTQVSSYYGYGAEPVRGEKIHTFIRLAQQLEYCYKRDTAIIYGNVVKATHGETRNEVLGSGDGSQALQSFTLKQPPLTYVAASNPRGVDSTLHVRVNEVEWHEAENLAELGSTDHQFITRTADDDKTTVIFGTGKWGARLPTGVENVKAVYRNGIGKPGNVKAEQISLLTTRPLGVKEVINPLRASGGADKENRDQARKNAPLEVLALDRLVSTQDYADFARRFAGIGKASAARLSDGRRRLVHVTIAGADDIPIDKSSDLYRNLIKALREFGDPHQPVQVELRELMLIVMSANVRILPDYLWEPVAKQIRTKLLDTFSFERSELGQDVFLSEIISVIQSVEGVAYVDVDTLRGIPEKTANEDNPGERRLLTPTEIANRITGPLMDNQGQTISEPLSRLTVNLADFERGLIRPAQLAFLSPEVEATLILNEVMP